MTKEKKSTIQSFENMFGKEITKEWLYKVAVKLHQCQDWYDTVIKDPKVTNKVFDLPVAAVVKSIEKPCKERDTPVLYNPHSGKVTCGISALSSAFYFRYDTNLASLVHLQRRGYVYSLSKPALKQSRKSSNNFLNQIILGKLFKMYYFDRKKQMRPWKDILGMTKYYDHIFLCIVKSNLLSGDQIIAITRG